MSSEKPTEEFARQMIAMSMGVSPDKIVNVQVLKKQDGVGWDFFGNLKVDKPRYHGVMVMK